MNKEAVILIPCYDPNEKIMSEFIEELGKEFSNIVFIDDGCNKSHDDFMKKLAKNYPVFKHYVNLGKGRGLKNGINYILNNYPEAKVIVTADCDGQHSVKDIKRVFQASLENEDALVLGCRDFSQNNVPFNSRYGNKITRNILYNYVGAKVSDTQTGLRAMSMAVAKKLIAVPGERYEYETNVLIETKKQNIPIKEITIDTIYIDDNATSHFNPLKDSIRIYKFFASYIIVTFIAYLIETFLFVRTYNYIDQFWSPALFLLISKILSTFIILLFNRQINFILTIFNTLITVIVILLLPKWAIMLKIVVDIIMFLISLFVNSFKPIKAK